MRIICAWCGKIMRHSHSVDAPSHGICEDCAVKQLAENLPPGYIGGFVGNDGSAGVMTNIDWDIGGEG